MCVCVSLCVHVCIQSYPSLLRQPPSNFTHTNYYSYYFCLYCVFRRILGQHARSWRRRRRRGGEGARVCTSDYSQVCRSPSPPTPPSPPHTHTPASSQDSHSFSQTLPLLFTDSLAYMHDYARYFFFTYVHALSLSPSQTPTFSTHNLVGTQVRDGHTSRTYIKDHLSAQVRDGP